MRKGAGRYREKDRERDGWREREREREGVGREGGREWVSMVK